MTAAAVSVSVLVVVIALCVVASILVCGTLAIKWYYALSHHTTLEVCMGTGKTGIPWEWELRRGSCHQKLRIVFCSYIVTWSKGSNAGSAIQLEIEQVVLN